MRYLMGVDNTDNAKSQGTGNLVRKLAEWLQADGAAEPNGITRHQLLAHRRIPYTGRNSSVCLSLDTENMEAVWETARDFLLLEAAGDADAGLCMARWDAVSRDVIAFAHRAKEEVLKREEAEQVASRSHVRSAALRGKGGGIIGALAAIGLHREGNDGRFHWLPGLPELQGTHSVEDLLDKTPIERVCSVDNVEIPPGSVIEVGEWIRPLLRDGQATLLVEKKKHGWLALDKESVKALSD